MRLVASILFLLFSSFVIEDKKSKDGCVELDIILIADLSASVSGHEEFIHDALVEFVNRFELSENGIRIGLIRFANDASIESELTSDRIKLLNAINSIGYPNGTTDLTDGLNTALNEFKNNGRPLVGKIAIVISDGDPDDEDSAYNSSILLKEFESTMICGIFINAKGGHSGFLELISSSTCYMESSYDDLATAIQKMDVCL
jgi:Mg-chelatase subunit ChlD